MSFTAAEGRTRLLADVRAGLERISAAIALLGAAYERIDEQAGEALESALFRPLQGAYAQGQRTYAAFAERTGTPAPAPSSAPELPASLQPGDALARAADELDEADGVLAELQDSMLPVEVGDVELRAGISGVRTAIAPLPGRARELTRRLGR